MQGVSEFDIGRYALTYQRKHLHLATGQVQLVNIDMADPIKKGIGETPRIVDVFSELLQEHKARGRQCENEQRLEDLDVAGHNACDRVRKPIDGDCLQSQALNRPHHNSTAADSTYRPEMPDGSVRFTRQIADAEPTQGEESEGVERHEYDPDIFHRRILVVLRSSIQRIRRIPHSGDVNPQFEG